MVILPLLCVVEIWDAHIVEKEYLLLSLTHFKKKTKEDYLLFATAYKPNMHACEKHSLQIRFV